MKGLGIRTLGKIEMFEVPVKPVEENEVKVEIHSVGLNPADYRTLFGSTPFFQEGQMLIGGLDFAGVVIEVGKKVTKFRIGDTVYGCNQLPNYGAMAEYIVIDQKHIIKKPENLSFSEAATLAMPFQTAYMNLFTKAGLQKGQTLLVIGGAGGVGSCAVALAKENGCRVIATGLSKDIEKLKTMPVDLIINSESPEEVCLDEKADVMFDTVGVNAQAQLIQFVKDNGIVVSSAAVESDPSITDNKTIQFLPFEFCHGTAENFKLANSAIEKGLFTPLVDKEYEFTPEALTEALNQIWSNKKKGRLVLKVK